MLRSLVGENPCDLSPSTDDVLLFPSSEFLCFLQCSCKDDHSASVCLTLLALRSSEPRIMGPGLGLLCWKCLFYFRQFHIWCELHLLHLKGIWMLCLTSNHVTELALIWAWMWTQNLWSSGAGRVRGWEADMVCSALGPIPVLLHYTTESCADIWNEATIFLT